MKTTLVLPIILFFIMFSMGLAITMIDFKNVAKYPKAFVVGGLLQLLSLPLFAFIFASLGYNVFSMQAELAAGMMIIAACPGGVTSNLLTHLGKGDTALSISLTAVMSIASVFTIPFIVNIGLQHFSGTEGATQLDVTRSTIQIFLITVIPLSIGMLIKAFKSDFADWLEPKARKTATFLFVLIVLSVIAKNAKVFTTASAILIPLVLAFNICTMLFAALMAKISKLSPSQSTAIVFECGLQNGTMAIVIALTLLESHTMMIPAAIYSVLMFKTAGAYMWLNRKAAA